MRCCAAAAAVSRLRRSMQATRVADRGPKPNTTKRVVLRIDPAADSWWHASSERVPACACPAIPLHWRRAGRRTHHGGYSSSQPPGGRRQRCKSDKGAAWRPRRSSAPPCRCLRGLLSLPRSAHRRSRRRRVRPPSGRFAASQLGRERRHLLLHRQLRLCLGQVGSHHLVHKLLQRGNRQRHTILAHTFS